MHNLGLCFACISYSPLTTKSSGVLVQVSLSSHLQARGRATSRASPKTPARGYRAPAPERRRHHRVAPRRQNCRQRGSSTRSRYCPPRPVLPAEDASGEARTPGPASIHSSSIHTVRTTTAQGLRLASTLGYDDGDALLTMPPFP